MNEKRGTFALLFNVRQNVLGQYVFTFNFNWTLHDMIKLTVNTYWHLADIILHVRSLILSLSMGDTLIFMCLANACVGVSVSQRFE